MIRGGKIISSFDEKSSNTNEFQGKEMKRFIDVRIKEVEKFLSQIKKGIDLKNSNYDNNRYDLLKIKENIQLIQSQKENIDLDLEKINQILEYYDEQ